VGHDINYIISQFFAKAWVNAQGMILIISYGKFLQKGW